MKSLIILLFTLLSSIVINAQTYTKANYGLAITDIDKKSKCVSLITSEVDSSLIHVICVHIPSGEIVHQMYIYIDEDDGFVSSDSVYVHAFKCTVTLIDRKNGTKVIPDVLIMLKYSDTSKRIDIMIHNANNKVLFRFSYLPKFI